ncbi:MULTISPECIES: hypothetical protein [unclassified Streptomyces]|uniref:hypothetical protein n=1 Tax=unclassified Streptomyces TaxID=2593676 RepID=UPI0022AEE84B|nr:MULTISPECIES: hypothetical protein [unclassified Streptomyces]MCZ4097297.1 hypothetical protein [Streptomyces sp. H39-C1]MCZ4120601.1 hypothetical protein [Streptomyces sp. H39-S7]
MIDWDTGVVILAKVIRRKEFVLGKSTVLVSRAVVLLDTGEVRTSSVRRDGRHVSTPFKWSFENTVASLREFEREFITEELSEWRRP